MFSFGDGFDCYAAPADAVAGYWDSGTASSLTLVAGRFAGGQAIQQPPTTGTWLVKSSGANDALHHIVVAFRQTATLTGTSLWTNFLLSDGASAQCSVLFRSDGAMLLYSGNAGTLQATYAGAVSAQSTWFAFEIEVFISSTGGYMNVRKNGNTSNDFTSATNLNTRAGTANNYANRLSVGHSTASPSGQQLDDLLWRSDASSVPWVGDIRCYTRMPASDAAVQFARTPTSNTQTPFTTGTTNAVTNGVGRYTPFTAAYDGTISTATVSLSAGYTGNMKCSIFASSGGVPTTVLGSANVLANPVTGSNTLTFGTPVAVTKGAVYLIGFDSDTTSGTYNVGGNNTGYTSTTTYASFPAASPTTALGNAIVCSLTITLPNFATVSETLQDGTTSYVYDSTVNDADFYTIAPIAVTPISVVAVTTRGFLQKSDAGTRGAAVQLKSGAVTVASTATLLSSSWGWLWRTELNDPNTSAAWTAAAVNNVQIGPKVTS